MEHNLENPPNRSTRRRLLFFLLGLFSVATVGLGVASVVQVIQSVPSPTSGHSSKSSEDYEGKVCTSPACVHRAGQVLNSLDKTVDPCHDFYQFACGNWLRTSTLPVGTSRFTRHNEIGQLVQKRMRELWEQPYDKTTESVTVGKAKALYKSCMDEDTMAALGVEPLRNLVDGLGEWPLTSSNESQVQLDLESTLGKLASLGVFPLFTILVDPDPQDSSTFLTGIFQPHFGPSLGSLAQGRSFSVTSEYQALLEQLAMHVLGLSSAPDLSDVVQFEVDLAKKMGYQTYASKSYRKMPISELQNVFPKFVWMDFLKSYFQPTNVQMTDVKQVVLYAEDSLKNLLDLYRNADQRVVANYLLMRVIYQFHHFLSKDIRELDAGLTKVMYGISQSEPRWRTCVKTMQNALPASEGQLYVSKYFPPSAKQKANDLIDDIKQAMVQLIQGTPWMDNVTMDKALDKLDANIQKVGYPDYQFNDAYIDDLYKDLDFQDDTFFENSLNLARYAVRYNSDRLLRKPSRTKWHHSAATPYAWYHQGRNTITIPAGILHPPFYSGDYPMTMMFGGIGVLIGNEFAHGFDIEGRFVDMNGNAIPWWSQSSVVEYMKRAQCFINEYNQQQQQAAGVNIVAMRTLGENIADNGGVRASFEALETWQRVNGREHPLPGLEFSNEQVFFVSYAQTRCSLITEAAMKYKIMTDFKSPNQFRVNVPLQNFDKFAEAFRCPAGSPMNPADKCRVW